MVMAILVHGVWLGASYTSLMGEVWRSQADLMSKAWIVQSTTAVYCFIFAYLYAKISRIVQEGCAPSIARAYEGAVWAA